MSVHNRMSYARHFGWAPFQNFLANKFSVANVTSGLSTKSRQSCRSKDPRYSVDGCHEGSFITSLPGQVGKRSLPSNCILDYGHEQNVTKWMGLEPSPGSSSRLDSKKSNATLIRARLTSKSSRALKVLDSCRLNSWNPSVCQGFLWTSTRAISGSSGKDGTSGAAESVGTDAHAITELALDSVVKIFTMASSPNYFLPWQNKPQREITGSGFVISGRRIVTNAHVVADQTYVVVRKHGSPCKYRAEVQAVGHECDLALLRVHDEEFWEGMRTLELGDIPFLQESVAVVGYPQGGDNISVTGGVVSRVEPTQYVHGAAHLMAIQIDAAINPGNSGGPALMEDKVVGVAFQNLAGAENIGYIIPVPIINRFLADVEERDRYIGFCSLGLTCQATENAQLREHLKMPTGLTGVLVNKIQKLTDTHQWIRKDDVLLAFDGVRIANDGTVHFRNRERISFDHLVSMKKAGEKARLSVLRDGKTIDVHVKLAPLRPLVPIHQFDRLPSYYIFAGLVFTPLTQPYLHEYGDDWYNTSPRRLCDRALTATLNKPGEQLVILSQVLMDEINAGYERLAELQVLSVFHTNLNFIVSDHLYSCTKGQDFTCAGISEFVITNFDKPVQVKLGKVMKVNGVEVHNLRHLTELVEACTLSNLRFDLDDGRVVVLNFQGAKEASLRILQRHRIPSHISVDLLQNPSRDALEECEVPQRIDNEKERVPDTELVPV